MQNSLITVRVRRSALEEAIRQAYVEGHWSVPPHPRFVTVHDDGEVAVSRAALHMVATGFSLLSLRCVVLPERLEEAPPTALADRGAFTAWIAANPVWFQEAAISELIHQADRKGVLLILEDR